MVRWKPVKPDYSDSGKGDLHGQILLELDWLNLLTCLKAQVIGGRSKITH